jgi:biopolymer transport protein ExbD
MPLKARTRARRLSLTSLIDVIFLLLLFFMLSSTFSRFSEIEISAAGAAGATAPQEDRQVFFLRLSTGGATLNGTEIALAALVEAVAARREDGPAVLLVSVGPEVTAQRLADALVAARALPDISITVLEGA